MAMGDERIVDHCTLDIPDDLDSNSSRGGTKIVALSGQESAPSQGISPRIGTTRTQSESSDYIHDQNQKEGSIPSKRILRWYFKEEQASTSDIQGDIRLYQDSIDSSNDIPAFEGTEIYQQPVIVSASHKTINWRIGFKNAEDNEDIQAYEIILGLSTNGLNTDRIDSIVLSFRDYSGCLIGPSEIVSSHTLKELSKVNAAQAGHSDILEWKLHHQRCLNITPWNVTFSMEIRLSKDPLNEVDTGYLEVHYMDVCVPNAVSGPQDPSLCIHRPYICSLNLPSQLVLAYGASGDGTHLAVLYFEDEQAILSLWDLRDQSGTSRQGGTLEKRQDRKVQTDRPPFHAKLCAAITVHLKARQRGSLEYGSFHVSVSWDASQIAITDRTCDDRSALDALAIYCYSSPAISPGGVPSLTIFVDDQLLPQLKNFFGHGKFHITATEDQHIKDELFITCNGVSVDVYSVYGKWKHQRVIELTEPWKFAHDVPRNPSWNLMGNIHGKHFLWYNQDGPFVSLWDIETGSHLWYVQKSLDSKSIDDSYDDRPSFSAKLSSDGSTVAINRNGGITIYWAPTGTVRGTIVLPWSNSLDSSCSSDTSIKWIRDDSQVLIGRNNWRDPGGEIEYIWDIASMSISDTFLSPGIYTAQPSLDTGSKQLLSSVHGSKLDIFKLEDRLVQPSSQSNPTCDASCRQGLSDLHYQPIEFVSASKLRYAIRTIATKRQGNQVKSWRSFSVHVSSTVDGQEKNFYIPAGHLGEDVWSFEFAGFLERHSRLVFVSVRFVMIWSLPATLDDDLALVLAWRIPSVKDYRQICEHQQLNLIEKYRSNLKSDSTNTDYFPRVELAFCRKNVREFQLGIEDLIGIFAEADDTCRAAIHQYLGSHINDYPDPDDPELNVLCLYCSQWNDNHHESYRQFLAALLGSPQGRWVYRQDCHPGANPLLVVLTTAGQKPRIMDLAEIIIDYCIYKTIDETDLHFLTPVTQCLHDLIGFHKDTALKTLRKFAYLPVRNRDFIIDNHKIAYPPEFRWRFWGPNIRPLHACTNPVLHLEYNSNPHDSKMDDFTQNLFVVPVDLLWDTVIHAPHSSSSSPAYNSRTQHTSTKSYSLIHTMWYKLSLKSKAIVICHEFTPEMFDNPAIAALIEYKWNTIGYAYWLVRFLCQCCFYLLVLTVVLFQVYSDQTEFLFGVFIAIIITSSIFLWLELIQVVKGPRRYLSSIYSVVNLGAFGLPLVGSIDQLITILSGTSRESVSALLSFAVLFISLQFLFELRVNEMVCEYVVIIIRIISTIRVFFFIFFGGVAAFTVAFLHLLRSCPRKSCPDRTASFPDHFYKAISSTFFFMGGRYDPINDDLDSDNWAFHTLMIVYFIFTVILMLNVLIALVNNAIGDSIKDRNWRLHWLRNRLRFVESSENMSYHLPGFRDSYKWFPKEIYYSATPSQVQAYKEKYSIVDDESVSISGTGESTQQKEKELEQLKEALKDEIKRELQHAQQGAHRECIETIQEQLKEQQEEILEAHFEEMKIYMARLLSAKP